MSVIRTEGLGVEYGQPVLRDVTLTIEAGEFVVILGPAAIKVMALQ